MQHAYVHYKSTYIPMDGHDNLSEFKVKFMSYLAIILNVVTHVSFAGAQFVLPWQRARLP